MGKNQKAPNAYTKINYRSFNSSEAGFLKHELEKNKISAVIQTSEENKQSKDKNHFLFVPKEKQEPALSIIKKHFSQDITNHLSDDKKHNSHSRFKKSLAGAFLGGITGARLGRHLKGHPIYYILCIVSLTAISFALSWKIWGNDPL